MNPSPRSTSFQAGEVAARFAGQRHAQILDHLRHKGPSTLFEIAAALNVFDHQISGRVTELVEQGIVIRTDQRRQKPETGCWADVLAIRDPPLRTVQELVEHLHGYPPTLIIDGEIWERAPTPGENDAPGVPYARKVTGAARLNYRVELLECPGCGRRLYLKVEKQAGKEVKTFPCNNPDCGKVWHLMLVTESGKSPTLALVLKHL